MGTISRMTKFSLPEFSFPQVKIPHISVPKLPTPGLDLTHIDLRKGAEKVAQLSKDALYVSVGTGVLAVQQLQVRRRELTASVQARIPNVAHHVGDVMTQVNEAVGQASEVANSARHSASKFVDSAVGSVRSRLRPTNTSAE
jgi:hypothetical protein